MKHSFRHWLAGGLVALAALSHTGFGQQSKAALDPEVQAEVERVCGFCHYPNFYDQETGTFDAQLFFSYEEKIRYRLQLDSDHPDRMPPATSPLQLKPGMAEAILNQL